MFRLPQHMTRVCAQRETINVHLLRMKMPRIARAVLGSLALAMCRKLKPGD